MRNYWSTLPLLRLWLAFTAGVLPAIYLREYPLAKLFALAFGVVWFCSLLTVLVHARLPVQKQVHWQRWQGVALVTGIIAFGFVLTYTLTPQLAKHYYGHMLLQENCLLVRVADPPVQKEKTVNLYAEVEQINYGGLQVNSSGKIQLGFIKDSNSLALGYGDVLLLNAKVKSVSGPQNPEEFDYKAYQARHQIYYTAFLTPGKWKVLKQDAGLPLLSAIYKVRAYFLQVLRQHVLSDDDFGVATALMLGYRDFVNDEVMQAYSASGVIHVLSVSGLHVGVIYLMLNFLLGWMETRGRKFVLGKTVLIVGFIWLYACLTGLCPSVLRSATMFTMLQVGKAYSRKANNYNLLAGSAVLLMLFNPFIITEVGFLLSYLAVVGILFLQPRIQALVTVKNYWLNLGWQLTSVSLAAQVVTFPLATFYFHQFPNLFLLTNLFIIPWSDLVLMTGVALFAVSWIPGVGMLVGFMFNSMLWVMDRFIFWIDSIPYALTTGISMNGFETPVLYVLLFLCCWLLIERRSKVLLATLALVVVVLTSFSVRSIKNNCSRQLVVYKVKDRSAVAFLDGKQAHVLFDDSLLLDDKQMRFHVLNHWCSRGVSPSAKADSGVQLPIGKIYSCEGKRLLLIDRDWPAVCQPSNTLRVDFVVLAHNPKVYIDRLNSAVSYKQLIFDSSNRKAKVTRWQTDCERLHISCWNVNEQGAFIQQF